MIQYSWEENNHNIKFQAIKVSYHLFKVRIYSPILMEKLLIISQKMIIIKDRTFLGKLDILQFSNSSMLIKDK